MIPDLVNGALAAAGGLERWSEVTGLVVHGSLGGPFWAAKGWPDVYANRTIEIDTRTVDITFTPSPGVGRSSRFVVRPDGSELMEILDGDRVVDDRISPRRSFPPVDAPSTWDAIQVAYFTSCAMWNYLVEPFLFTYPGVECHEIEPWDDRGELWRRLAVHFPTNLPNHNPDQVFYYDKDFRLRRMDYAPDVTGAAIAHLTDEHREFDGFVLPTRRRVHLRRPDGTADTSFAPITIDIDDVGFVRG